MTAVSELNPAVGNEGPAKFVLDNNTNTYWHTNWNTNTQTTALARAMCEKLLARNLTAQDDARLLDDLLEKAGAGNGN